MRRAIGILAIVVIGTCLPGFVLGATVEVTIAGVVTFNGISEPPLSNVATGNEVIMRFAVDSDDFVDGVPGDTRGYPIDPSSFQLLFDTPVTVELLDPLPTPAYFTLVDGFPVADGFFVATSPVSPGGVPLEQEPYQANVDLGYTGETLDSLDILDAAGAYGFDGLTRFGYNLWSVVPDNVAMEIDFLNMTIVETGGDGGADDGGDVSATTGVGVVLMVLLLLGGSAYFLRRGAAKG